MAAHVWEERGALNRLSELSLEPSTLRDALLRADAASANSTPFHPTSFEGYTRWAELVSSVRETLTARGWTFDDPRNLPRAISPDGQLALLVSSGDEFTGLAYAPSGYPSTKNPKGATVSQAVEVNEQLAFDLGPGFTAGRRPATADELVTWVLLYHYGPEVISAEISRPIAMTGQQISEWAERILLPNVPRDPGFQWPATQDNPDDGDLYDVQLTRRA